MKRNLAIGILGAGMISETHLQAYRALGVSVCGIADIDGARAAAKAKNYKVTRSFADWQELVRRDDVSLIDICTPPAAHAVQIIAALKHEKNVICEKPLAPSLAEIDMIQSAEKSSGSSLTILHQHRFSTENQRLKWLLDSNFLGRIYAIRILRCDPPPMELIREGQWGKWAETGGGVVMTKAIHQLEILLWLLGKAKKVTASMGTFSLAIESEDQAVGCIEFETGVQADFYFTAQPRYGMEGIQIIAENGCVESPWKTRFYDRKLQRHVENELKREYPDFFSLPHWACRKTNRLLRKVKNRIDGTKDMEGDLHYAFLKDFLSRVRQGKPAAVSSQDARAAVELCTAIYTAALTGQQVELPLNAGERFYGGVRKEDYAK